jgi:hypothetical protein
MGRAIGAVVVGFVVWTVLWLGGNAGLMAAMPGGVDEETGAMSGSMGIAALVLSVVCSLAGGLSCGAIVRRPKPALVLGGVLLLVGAGVQFSMWDKAPVWYHVSFLVLLVPVTVVGASVVRGGRQG